MRKTPILVTCLASVVLGTLASVSADAATSRKWWMRDWNCTNAHQQKMQIKSQIIDDMECNEDYCTVSSDAVAILKVLADANRQASGNLRYEVVQQANRPNHFTVFEVWRSRSAFDANIAAPPQREFRDKLGVMTGALYDERLYEVLK